MEFRDWLMQEFLKWEKTQSNGRSNYSNFARYLGIGVNKYAQWRNGNNLPSYESARLLAEKLGNEVYPLLGFDTPGEVDPFANLPPELRLAIVETNRRIASLGSQADLSTSLKILAEEIKPFELMLTSKTDNDGSTK